MHPNIPAASASHPFSYVENVGIIGGGIAGLQTSKALAAQGFQCTIFEAAPQVGGVWRSNYSGFGVQVPKELYEFADFPFTAAAPGEFASGPKVQQYILDYVAHYKLGAMIRSGTAVQQVAPNNEGWNFTVKDTTGKTSTECFDYAVCATGMYSTPAVPFLPGAEGFRGTILHSKDFQDASLAKGKNVVVLGSAKSAIDCVLEADKAGAAGATLLARNAHWGTPRNIAGLIPFKFVFLSRFGQALVSWYKGAWPTAPSSVKGAHSMLAPIMGPVSSW